MASSKRLKSILVIVITLILSYYSYNQREDHNQVPAPASMAVEHTNDAVIDAFKSRRSDVQVEGAGRVEKILPDDTKGSRHQRFIVSVADNHTVLIAHNIDLAPRIAGLKKGDRVVFNGEYEYNERGGVIHWTHHDPRKRHADGWLEHKNKRYQ